MRLSLQQNNLILETQQCSFSNYFKSLLPNQSKLFFSLREQFIYQITVISCTVSLLLPHTHPNKPPTSAFPNETTTSITSGLILLWFIACTSHTHTHTPFLILQNWFFLLTPGFTGGPSVSPVSTELYHLPTPLQRQFEEADPVEACSPKPWVQHALPIKLKVILHGISSIAMECGTRPHPTNTPQPKQTHLWFNHTTEPTWSTADMQSSTISV